MGREKLKKALGMSTDELFRELYIDYAPSAGVLDESETDQKQKGIRIFEMRSSELRDLLCSQQEAIASKIQGDPMQLAVVIADLVASSTIGLAPFIVSALIVRIGLKHYCSDYQG